MMTFKIVMIATFIAAAGTLLAGVMSMGFAQGAESGRRGNKLMFLRVGLCAMLLVEILVYAFFFKGI